MNGDYQSFLASKAPRAHASGFEPSAMPHHLFDFQQHCVDFAIRQGRTGTYLDCMAGETLIHTIGGLVRIDRLAAIGRPIIVKSIDESGMIVNAVATAPFRKGSDRLYSVKTASGREALATAGHHASEDGTGRGTPIIAIRDEVTPKFQSDLAFTLTQPSPSGGGHPQSIAYGIRSDAQREGLALTPSADAEGRVRLRNPGLGISENVAPTLEARQEVQAVCFDSKGTQVQTDETGAAPTLRSMNHDQSHQNGGGQLAVAFDMRGREGGSQFEGPHETANIRASSGESSRSYVAQTWAVRRLTPLECCRLQGFPEYRAIIRLFLCSSDHRLDRVTVDGQCHRSQKSVPLAEAERSMPSVRIAEQTSSTSLPESGQPVALHVLINSGRKEVQISSAGKLIWSASDVEKQNGSALPMPVADFVRLAVATTIIAAKTTRIGKVVQPYRTKYSTHPESGHWLVEMCGAAINQYAKDAVKSTDEANSLSTFITSSDGPHVQTLEQIAQTLFYSVVDAIASFIPTQIQDASSFELMLRIEDDYFAAAEPIADGPKYKMLGNSMAVNCMRWIGEQIAAVDSLANGGDLVQKNGSGAVSSGPLP